MKKIAIAIILCCAAATGVVAAPKNKKKEQSKSPSALDKYIEQASEPEIPNGPPVATGSSMDPRCLVLGSGGGSTLAARR